MGHSLWAVSQGIKPPSPIDSFFWYKGYSRGAYVGTSLAELPGTYILLQWLLLLYQVLVPDSLRYVYVRCQSPLPSAPRHLSSLLIFITILARVEAFFFWTAPNTISPVVYCAQLFYPPLRSTEFTQFWLVATSSM